MKIECPVCKFVTSFVTANGITTRDFKKHGNKSESMTCFNCNVPLKQAEPKAEPVIDLASPPVIVKEPEPTVKDEPVDKDKKKRLGRPKKYKES